jgi:hypothetical protein
MGNQAVKAKIHSDLPNQQSERPFAEKIQALDFPSDNQPQVWFIKLPGIKDIDAIIWLPKGGLFIVEMKSYPLSGIRHISTQRFEVEAYIPHSTKKSPWEQVNEAKWQLTNRLGKDNDIKKVLGNLWVSSVVALYRIQRSNFNARFQGQSGSQAEKDFKNLVGESSLFEEDLGTGEAFIERLKHCKFHPIYGQPPNPNYGSRLPQISDGVKVLHNFFDPHLVATRPVSAYDRERLKDLEGLSERRLNVVVWEKPIICTGFAGTGKTFLGLRSILHRIESLSEAKRDETSTLFICFNKVLAADIRRLVSLSQKFRQLKFDIFDIFELTTFLANRCRINTKFQAVNADIWADQVLSEILARKDKDIQELLDGWDFIVVDESQDLQDWSWNLLDRLSKNGNRLFVIDGKNQLLYRDKRAVYLDFLYEINKETENKSNFIEQRRVFRTTDATFLLSQLFMETYPDLSAAENYWQKKLKPAYEKEKEKLLKTKKSNKQLSLLETEFELPRQGGYQPRLIPLTVRSEDEVVTEVTNFLRTGYNKTKEYYREDEPSNVLVLVPFKKNESPQEITPLYDWGRIARTACQNLNLRFIDYSDEQQRRKAYAGDEVRICTFNSSRGIEGLHSIILGFDSLAEAAGEDWRVENLGYITLSRSVYDTDIIYVENPLVERREIKFLKGIIEITGL